MSEAGRSSLAAILADQFDTAERLLEYHLANMTDEECLWRPAARGPHVHRDRRGCWIADWPEDQSYSAGPPSIAWLGWHLIFWLSMLIDHSLGRATLSRETIAWPGSADRMTAEIRRLAAEWRTAFSALDERALLSPDASRWPKAGIPFASTIAWSSIEMTKNAAEIGVLRFLYAARAGA